ncbi:hypothetical protein BGZ99_008821 [Dissophora globulifera]|uniref:CRAL-TRIO domain-containing protein n=1 Tax=Dissophora globulifera TaxID=979702 RepID=A0A9P6RR10_9FUNG|nr:hypothetical protein BGZ99_008821 [Dissophora globulifera]
MTSVIPIAPTEGHIGHLTREQTKTLQEFWIRIYDIFDGRTLCDSVLPASFKGQVSQSEDSSQVLQAPAQTPGWFGFGSSASSSSTHSSLPSGSVTPTLQFSGEKLHKTFWKMNIMNNPDMIALKFIRARKWVVNDAVKMFLDNLKWRIIEDLDELSELSDVELDSKYPNFIDQLQSGKGYLRGADSRDRPISIINTRLHHKTDQPPETLHRFTLYTMECGRRFLSPGKETVIVLFDLSDFGLDNMDWSFVRLFVQCFESYYPETLGTCIVHRAPYVFWGIWRLIQPLLDPAVAGKFVFTRTNAELHQVVPREHLSIEHYDGLDDWTYNYVPEVPGESHHMEDSVTKENLLQERHALELAHDHATRAWISNVDGSDSPERLAIAQQLHEQYARLSPYIHAVNLYQRWGVAVDGQVNWNYNVQKD